MLKIILVLWTLVPSGDIDRLVIEGFFDMERCEAAGLVFITPSPHDEFQLAQVFRCVEVPK